MRPTGREEALRLLARSSYTRRKLAARLVGRGLSEAEAGEVVEELAREIPELRPEGEAERLEEALETKRRRLPDGLTAAERSKKLLAHLVRRGFEESAVREALRQKGELHDAIDGLDL